MSSTALRSKPLFYDMFPLPVAEKQRKGRSENFDADRNKLLLSRFWYYGQTTGYRFEILLKIIAKQFHIAERTANNVISENRLLLKEIRTAAPTKKELEKEYPWLSWEKPEMEFYL